jgi:cellulose synthase/poly-beta-1,6-N-acetylglucosamine synthase-like glycosyltransferase
MVAVHNEENFVTVCLEAMFNQSYRKTEVIVVNDASTDGTLKVLQEYKRNKHPELVIINLTKNVGKKAALCVAMRKAKGKIYAHTDSDSVWNRDAIERIVRIFVNDANVGAVSGHGRANNAGHNFITKLQDTWMEGQFSIRKAFESSYGTVTCVSGPLAVYRKEAVYNLLPAWRLDRFLGAEFRFATDRTLTAMVLGAPWLHKCLVEKHYPNEFTEVIYKPRKWKVLYSRSARSKTIVPDTFSKFMKQQIRWKKSFIRNAFFNVPFFWRKPLPVAAVYYGHILFVVCAPLIVSKVFLLPHDNYWGVIGYYVASVFVIGALFALALRFEDKTCRYWYYRPVMSLFSSLILSWVVIYSALTVRRMKWHRG